MVATNPFSSVATDGSAGDVGKYQDDLTITVTDNVVKKPVSLATQGTTDNVTDSVIDAKNSVQSGLTTVIVTDKTKKGLCEFCGDEFDKKVSWKRFCCDDCRIKAWELKSGKQWKGKKVI